MDTEAADRQSTASPRCPDPAYQHGRRKGGGEYTFRPSACLRPVSQFMLRVILMNMQNDVLFCFVFCFFANYFSETVKFDTQRMLHPPSCNNHRKKPLNENLRMTTASIDAPPAAMKECIISNRRYGRDWGSNAWAAIWGPRNRLRWFETLDEGPLTGSGLGEPNPMQNPSNTTGSLPGGDKHGENILGQIKMG